MNDKKIAFIGLGNMGGPMAANLVKVGFEVAGFDLSEEARMAASKAGISLAQSAAEAVKGASALMTMLPAGKHVIGVWAEVLPHLAKCALVIDSSTIDMTSARRAHLIASEQGCLSLDAPVSGGVGGARAGTLTFMVGGAKEAFSRGEQILKHMGTRIVHCGDAGAGQAAKICNNMILGVSMAAVCEAFVLGEKLGLSHQALFDVASNSSGQVTLLVGAAWLWRISSYSTALSHYGTVNTAKPTCFFAHVAAEAARHVSIPMPGRFGAFFTTYGPCQSAPSSLRTRLSLGSSAVAAARLLYLLRVRAVGRWTVRNVSTTLRQPAFEFKLGFSAFGLAG
jgi:3-hydroxyisobutyrate dehydrogenase